MKAHVIGRRAVSVREVANILGTSFGVVERFLKTQTVCNVELGGLVPPSPSLHTKLSSA
jgi:hypothetical protein